MRLAKFIVLLCSLFLLSACNFTVDEQSDSGSSSSSSASVASSASSSSSSTGDWFGVLSCSATLPASGSGTTLANQPTPITVNVSGGLGNYTISGISTSFPSSTTISRVYTNTTSVNKVVTDTVKISDARGYTAQCTFTVTVLPVVAPPTLGCNIEVTPAAPEIGQQFFLVATATAGQKPYSFHNLKLGVDGVQLEQLENVSSAQVSASGKYTSGGMKTVSIQVEDDSDSVVTCTQSVKVPLPLQLAITTSPASSASLISPITVNAVATNFSSVPTYVFSNSDAGISLTPNGGSVVVRVTDGLIHSDVRIGVIASADGKSIAGSTLINFTAAPLLNCTIAGPTGGSVGLNANAQFVVSSPSDAIEITSFDPGLSGTVVAQTAASRTVKYSTITPKTVSLHARSASTKVACNNGNLIQASVNVVSPLSCTAVTYFNPSYIGDYVLASAAAIYPSGSTTLRGVTVTYQGYTYVPSTFGSNGPNSTYIQLPYAGVYTVRLTIGDSSGATAVCSTTQVVRDFWW